MASASGSIANNKGDRSYPYRVPFSCAKYGDHLPSRLWYNNLTKSTKVSPKPNSLSVNNKKCHILCDQTVFLHPV